MNWQVVVVFVFFPIIGQGLERGERCTNMWGEKATCTTILSCKAAIDAAEIAAANGTIKVYAAGSVCGYDTEPLVCCKTVSDYDESVENNNTLSPANSLSIDSTSLDLNLFASNSPFNAPNQMVQLGNNRTEDKAFTGVDTRFESQNSATPPTEAPVPSLPTPSVGIDQVLPDQTVCGTQVKRNRLPNAIISSIDEFPWMGLLKYQDTFGKDVGFRCVATLVTKRHLIASAHCIASEPFKLKSVRLGEWSISSPTDCIFDNNKMVCPKKVIDIGIEKTFVHPDQNIALIRMEWKVDFTDYVRPICLAPENLPPPIDKTILISSGWGASKSGNSLDIKSKIRLPVLPKSKCLSNEGEICVDALSRNKVCKTDTGGPIMSLDQKDDSKWYLEGVIPEGFDCNNQGTVGIYARISKHISWILATLRSDGV